MTALDDKPKFELTDPASLPDDPAATINRHHLAALQDKVSPQDVENRHLHLDEDGNVVLAEPVVRRHGELGAVLVERGHKFSGPTT